MMKNFHLIMKEKLKKLKKKIEFLYPLIKEC